MENELTSRLENKVDKILDLQTNQSIDIALIKQSQNILLSDYKETKLSHYKLKDEFKGLKSKIIVLSGIIGACTTFAGNWIYRRIF